MNLSLFLSKLQPERLSRKPQNCGTMTKKQWWQNIKYNYPKALNACREYFEPKWPDTWRARMQKPTELITYFQGWDIHIDIRPRYQEMRHPRFGYKLYAKIMTLIREPTFTARDWAAYDALEFAFRICERELQETKSTYHQGMHRRKNPTPRSTRHWGREAQKAYEEQQKKKNLKK